MKTKKLFYGMAVIVCLFVVASCSKSSTSSTSGSGSGTDAATQADDQTFYTNETDYATNDANLALDSYGGSYNSRPASPASPIPIAWPCDTTSVIVDTTTSHSITITYNGSNCGVFNHKRTGTIVLSFSPGFKWGTQGASLTLTFNLNVTRVNDGKTINITGTRAVTNATGGLLRNLLTVPGDSIAYTISDNTKVTFSSGGQRSWQTNLRRSFIYNLSSYGGAGIITVGSLSGTNRFGSNFSADITQPLVVPECNDFLYASGQITYTGALGGTSTTTFGLTSSGGVATTCSTNLYYQFVWTGPNGGTYNSGYIGY